MSEPVTIRPNLRLLAGPEQLALDEVPESLRHGRTAHTAWLWFAANLGLPAWSLGLLALTLRLSPWEAVAAVLVGNLVGAALLALVSALGPEAGVPAIALGGRIFGPGANRLPSALNSLSCLGWYAVNLVLGGEALARLAHLPWVAALVLLTGAITLVGVYGHDAVHRVERWAGYGLGALFLLTGVRVALTWHGMAAGISLRGAGVGSFLLVVAVVASYLFSWAPYATDYSRYLPRGAGRAAVGRATFGGSFLATAGVQLLGVLTGAAAGTAGGPVDVMARSMGPWAGPALVAVILGTVTANSLNLYTGAMSVLSVGIRISRPWAAVLFGLLGGVAAHLAAGGFEAAYENFLLLISYWVAPWIGVVLAWAWRHPPEERFPAAGPALRPWLLASFLAGLVATVPFMNQALYEGWLARLLGGGDVGYWVGLAVAFLVAWLGVARPARKEGAST
ncbi:MAG: cytosine permease [Bacillota bacterium]|nr:cytosine permease [Bacillota bacterium]